MDPWINAHDYKEVKKTCVRLYRECAATAGYVNTRIPPQDQVRQRPEQTSRRTWRGFWPNWFRNTMDISSSCDYHEFFFFIFLVATILRLQEIAIPVQATVCVHRTPRRSIFLLHTVCQAVLSGSYPSLTFHALAWLKMRQRTFFQYFSYLAQHVLHYTWGDQHALILHPHSFLSFGTTYLQLLRLSILARSIPATIHNKWVSAFRLMFHQLHFGPSDFWACHKDCGLAQPFKGLNNSGSLLSFSQTNVLIETLQSIDSERVVKFKGLYFSGSLHTAFWRRTHLADVFIETLQTLGFLACSEVLELAQPFMGLNFHKPCTWSSTVACALRRFGPSGCELVAKCLSLLSRSRTWTSTSFAHDRPEWRAHRDTSARRALSLSQSAWVCPAVQGLGCVRCRTVCAVFVLGWLVG